MWERFRLRDKAHVDTVVNNLRLRVYVSERVNGSHDFYCTYYSSDTCYIWVIGAISLNRQKHNTGTAIAQAMFRIEKGKLSGFVKISWLSSLLARITNICEHGKTYPACGTRVAMSVLPNTSCSHSLHPLTLTPAMQHDNSKQTTDRGLREY